MYKVFVDNKPLFFQINSEITKPVDPHFIWEQIRGFLLTEKTDLTIEIGSESDFQEIFAEYKYMEAAGGLVQREDSYLFIKRNGIWDIPKGKLEKGETIEEGAIREIEEECGLKSPIIKEHLIDTWHTFEHRGGKKIKKTYWYWLDEGEEKVDLIPQQEEGITEVAYFKKEDFEKIKANTYLSIIDVLDALQKKQ